MKKVICRPEKGSDGWWRIMIDVYFCFGRVPEIQSALKEATNIEWKHFGTFMDCACYATKEKPPKKFSVEIPWNE